MLNSDVTEGDLPGQSALTIVEPHCYSIVPASYRRWSQPLPEIYDEMPGRANRCGAATGRRHTRRIARDISGSYRHERGGPWASRLMASRHGPRQTSTSEFLR